MWITNVDKALSELSAELKAIFWDDHSLHSSTPIPSSQPELKALILKTINGNGSNGILDQYQTLSQLLEYTQSIHYNYFRISTKNILITSPDPSLFHPAQIICKLILETADRMEKIKAYTQRKQVDLSNNLSTINEQQQYTQQLLTDHLYLQIPVLRHENVLISKELLQLWTAQQTPAPQIIAQVREFVELAEILGLKLLNYELVPGDLAEDLPVSHTSVSYQADKTSILLDRYEKAASQAQRNGLEVNGKNVACLIEPAVSPAAITDALKKNRKKITHLLISNPEKWPLIRKGLRPLQLIEESLSAF